MKPLQKYYIILALVLFILSAGIMVLNGYPEYALKVGLTFAIATLFCGVLAIIHNWIKKKLNEQY